MHEVSISRFYNELSFVCFFSFLPCRYGPCGAIVIGLMLIFLLPIKGIIPHLENIGHVFFKKFECEIVNTRRTTTDDDIGTSIAIGHISYSGHLK